MRSTIIEGPSITVFQYLNAQENQINKNLDALNIINNLGLKRVCAYISFLQSTEM